MIKKLTTTEITQVIFVGKHRKRITAAEIARGLGKDPAFFYKIKNGQQGCPALLAGEIDTVARAIANIKGLPPCALIGWRLIDLRPDIVEMVLRAMLHDVNCLPENQHPMTQIMGYLCHGGNGGKDKEVHDL